MGPISRYLGPEFRGDRLHRFLLAQPPERIPLFHSVGGLDPLEARDVLKPIGDGLPETLPEWIDYNGIVRIKIKLSGEDLRWDVERTLRIDRVAAEVQARRGITDWKYCLDFNERCPNVGYVLDCLRQIREGTPDGFARCVRDGTPPLVTGWDALAARVAGLPITDAGARLFQRQIFGGALEAELDRQGRVLLPAYLREEAGLNDEALVVGARDHAEIWAPDRWAAYSRTMQDPSAFAEAISGLGI